MGKEKLNERQKRFCELYASTEEFFGNGVQSYIEAYNPDRSKPGWYNSARSSASENLTKPDILEYINELLDAGGLNNEFVDKQLLFLINQQADFSAKIQAIREYNKLKQRITEKQEIRHTVEKISGFNYIVPDDTDNKTIS